jgi:DNA-binding response OmpR family regulator
MKKKICIVEDTPDLLDNFSEFLRMEGFDIFPCKNGTVAMEVMQCMVPDLIITDLWMPGMDGLKFIEEIRKDNRLNTVPVAIFSAKPMQEYEEKAKKYGVNAYIKKPAVLEDILKIVKELLQI